MVRLAKPGDLDLVYELCREAMGKAVYSHLPYNEYDARKMMARLILSESVWVTEKVDGVLMACIQPVWFNSELKTSSDLVFYVRERCKSEGYRLAKEYIKWAKEHVDWVCLSISFGGDIERTEKFYEKLGFVRMGGTYLLRGQHYVCCMGYSVNSCW